jgi:hypothetical protein
MLGIRSEKTSVAGQTIRSVSEPLKPAYAEEFISLVAANDHFSASGNIIYFPLWYPALIFALAGVGVLRFRRQFSIRSALVAVSVVAALLGMAVVL